MSESRTTGVMVVPAVAQLIPGAKAAARIRAGTRTMLGFRRSMPADLSRPVPQGRAGTGVTPDRCDHSLRTLGCGTANKISWPVSYKARTRTPAAGRQVPRAAKSTFDSLKLQPLSRLPEAASQGTDRRAFRPCQGGCGFAALRTAQAGGRPLHGRAASRDGPAHHARGRQASVQVAQTVQSTSGWLQQV